MAATANGCPLVACPDLSGAGQKEPVSIIDRIPSDPVIGLERGFDDRQQAMGITVQGPGQSDELDHIDPPLTALETGHEGLLAPKQAGQILLPETRAFASFNQRRTERDLTIASKCSCHASQSSCDVASG